MSKPCWGIFTSLLPGRRNSLGKPPLSAHDKADRPRHRDGAGLVLIMTDDGRAFDPTGYHDGLRGKVILPEFAMRTGDHYRRRKWKLTAAVAMTPRLP